MRLRDMLFAGTFGVLITACVGLHPVPSPEAKSALTPTGKIRVAFISTSIYAIKDSKTGEVKGIAVDLGNDLAHQLGATLEPKVYSNVTALLAGAKAGELDVALMGINAERAMVLPFRRPIWKSSWVISFVPALRLPVSRRSTGPGFASAFWKREVPTLPSREP